jgi:hypothetical protein
MVRSAGNAQVAKNVRMHASRRRIRMGGLLVGLVE